LIYIVNDSNLYSNRLNILELIIIFNPFYFSLSHIFLSDYECHQDLLLEVVKELGVHVRARTLDSHMKDLSLKIQ